MTQYESRTPFDFSIFFTALLLWGIGLALVYSATHIHTTGVLATVFQAQIVWVAMGIVLVLLVASIPTRYYYMFAYVAYGAVLIMLVWALVGGVVSKGASRWVMIAGFKIQPSEFAKLGLLLALARYLSDKQISLSRIATFIGPTILIVVPFGLVMKQPDLGTAMVFCAMSLPVMYWAGLSLMEVFLLVSPVVSLVLAAVPLVTSFAHHTTPTFAGSIPWGIFIGIVGLVLWLGRQSGLMWSFVLGASFFTATLTTVLWNSFLKDYQKMRIITFLNPQSDAAGSGYQVIQSMVAIGSGHLAGKGFLQGTQTRLSFLPEQHTDFIFSVLGEQFGLLGCSLVVLLFLFLIVKSYLTTQLVRNRFSNLLVVGAATILAFHIFVNIAMTLGMMPVTGVPLPFLSYGGSFTITVAVLVGLIINVRVNSQDF